MTLDPDQLLRERDADWGDGPWLDEPSHAEWTHMDLACVAHRHPQLGHWCAYVNVPNNHPLYGVGYSTETAALKEALGTRLEDPVGDFQFGRVIQALLGSGLSPTPEHVFDVHGGITYSGDGHFFGAPAGTFWYGFDCGHAMDLQPGLRATLQQIGSALALLDDETYRTLAFVQEQANHLAEQIAAVANPYA